MNIEEEIFKNSIVNIDKLIQYGFKKDNDNFIFESYLLNNEFKVIINYNNNIKGKIIDLNTNLEYTNIRTNMNGEFVNKVRNDYKKILIDIKNNCFDTIYFMYNQTNRIVKYIKDKYNDNPEFLWEDTPYCGVFRMNKKWYGIIMNINESKLNSGSEDIEIINVKLDKDKILFLLNKKGFYKAYHMNKNNWISIILNDTLKDDEIFKLIDESRKIISNK